MFSLEQQKSWTFFPRVFFSHGRNFVEWPNQSPPRDQSVSADTYFSLNARLRTKKRKRSKKMSWKALQWRPNSCFTLDGSGRVGSLFPERMTCWEMPWYAMGCVYFILPVEISHEIPRPNLQLTKCSPPPQIPVFVELSRITMGIAWVASCRQSLKQSGDF